jgi:hypothetical protein
MKVKIKHQGQLKLFNGMDIEQTKYYIKISCKTYFMKILKQYQWITDNTHSKPKPIPFPADAAYTKQLEETTPPSDEQDKQTLADTMNIHYQRLIGELVYPMVNLTTHFTSLSLDNSWPTQLAHTMPPSRNSSNIFTVQ